MKMTRNKKFKNESQDARRHDKHDAAHPDEKRNKHHEKEDQKRK